MAYNIAKVNINHNLSCMEWIKTSDVSFPVISACVILGFSIGVSLAYYAAHFPFAINIVCY